MPYSFNYKPMMSHDSIFKSQPIQSDSFGWPLPSCRFPDWLNGVTWRDLDNKHLLRLDQKNDTVFEFLNRKRKETLLSESKCVGVMEEESEFGIVLKVFTTQDCTSKHQCLRLIKRGTNVVEIQKGSISDISSQSRCITEHSFQIYLANSQEQEILECPVPGTFHYKEPLPDAKNEYKTKLHMLNTNVAYKNNNNLNKNIKISNIKANQVLNLAKSCQMIVKINCNNSRKLEIHSENCGRDKKGGLAVPMDCLWSWRSERRVFFLVGHQTHNITKNHLCFSAFLRGNQTMMMLDADCYRVAKVYDMDLLNKRFIQTKACDSHKHNQLNPFSSRNFHNESTVSKINVYNNNTVEPTSTKSAPVMEDNQKKEDKTIKNSYEETIDENYIFKEKPKIQDTYGSYDYSDGNDEENDEDDDYDDYDNNSKETVPFVTSIQQQPGRNKNTQGEEDQSNDTEYEYEDSSEEEVDEDDGDDEDNEYMGRYGYKYHFLNTFTTVSQHQRYQHRQQQQQRQQQRRQQNRNQLQDQHTHHNPYRYNNKHIVKVDFSNLNTVSGSEHIVRDMPSSSSSAPSSLKLVLSLMTISIIVLKSVSSLPYLKYIISFTSFYLYYSTSTHSSPSSNHINSASSFYLLWCFVFISINFILVHLLKNISTRCIKAPIISSFSRALAPYESYVSSWIYIMQRVYGSSICHLSSYSQRIFMKSFL